MGEAETVTGQAAKSAYVVALGNQKGGTGKSTIAMHVIVNLMRGGLSVGSVDLDGQQGTLSRYVENRKAFVAARGVDLPVPDHICCIPRDPMDRTKLTEDGAELARQLKTMLGLHDVVVIDTPGADTFLSRMGHAYADTLLTPLNDSLLDLDAIGRIDPATGRVAGPSHYAQMVWEIRRERQRNGRRPMSWVVVRNRLSPLDARNTREMERLLDQLAGSPGIQFQQVPGLSERVIYRELFLSGLTLLDLRDADIGIALSRSHVAARQELRTLLAGLGFTNV